MIKEIRALKKNDEEIDCEISITEVVVPQGSPRAFTAIMRDITERKQAAGKLDKTLEDLKRSNTELEQFASVASHDLQEPLRAVASYSQLLGKRYMSKLDPDADEFITYIVDGANRMQKMIENLLTYSRLGSRGKLFEQTDFNSVLGQAMVNLGEAIQQSQAIITNDELPAVMADSEQLIQLLQNLIGNAIKFRSDAPPHVHISAEQKGSECVYSVCDNGIGIAPEFAERIFIIFQRLHDREKYPGTGIGLAICKKIVERHGGKIWIESKLNEGSTFYFTIPIRR